MNSSNRRTFWLILSLGFLIRIALTFATRVYRFGWTVEPVDLAISLAQRGTFADPFGSHSGLSAHSPPLYPFLLSVLVRLFGSGVPGFMAFAVFASVQSSLQWALFVFLPGALQIPRRVPILAAFAGALFPFQRAYEIDGLWENILAACALIGLTSLTATWLRDRSRRATVVMALSWGLALYVTPGLLPVLVAWLGYGLFAKALPERSVPTYARNVVLMTVIIALTVLPWTARNYYQLGSPVWSRDNFGLELHMAYNDCAVATFEENTSTGCYQSLHPTSNFKEILRIRQIGEVGYNREKLDYATRWIREHPARFFQLTALHIVKFWFGRFSGTRPGLGEVLTGIYWVQTLLSFAGLWLLFRQNREAAWILGLAMLAFPLVYYVAQASLRYRYPVYWITELLAVQSLVCIYDGFRDSSA